MKNIFLFLTIAISSVAFGQDNYQSFRNAGFKVKCPCALKVNSTFIQMMKGQNKSVIGAYICAENEDNPEYGVINNIHIYDEADSHAKISSNDYSYFEKKYLEEYANQLAANGMTYNYVTYKGVSALEYSFDQISLPTKAIMFLKNKKSYLLQVGSRNNLDTKFSSLKTSFELL
jgi:hypothetical protein